MAVSPAVSYVAPRPAVPQYFTKFLNSERYVLNPRALMYQCLKKWETTPYYPEAFGFPVCKNSHKKP